MKYFWVLVGVVCLSIAVASDDDGQTANYLWDLSTDPYETVNQYDNPDYADIRESLESQLFSLFTDPNTIECDGLDISNESEIVADAYAECGGVCSYLDEDKVIQTEQIYFPDSPPNIVFMLVDDWGYNDVGYQSTYMKWATPNIDNFVTEGVTLSNYYSHYFCIPSRGALMTGRTANRLGLLEHREGCELPLTEVTIAEEMKTAGYKTYMVGKWHLGYSSTSRAPLERGFDYFYGYYSGFIDYNTKINDCDYLDLQANGRLETDADKIDSDYHSGYLFQSKAEEVIRDHAEKYSDTPMFLYYSLQLVHFPYSAPDVYTERCYDPDSSYDYSVYCGLNLMLDEVVANVTCTLESTGMLDNTVVVLASDNGGSSDIPGSSLPFRGHKYDYTRGGVSANAYIFSKLLSDSMRGTSYDGLMHVSDWLPTLMTVATNGAWTGSYSGAELDGKNQWDAIMSHGESPRTVIVHFANYNDNASGSIQVGNYKLDYGIVLSDYDYPDILNETTRGQAYYMCDNPSYSQSTAELFISSIFPSYGSSSASLLVLALSVLFTLGIVVSLFQLLKLHSARETRRLYYGYQDESKPLVGI